MTIIKHRRITAAFLSYRIFKRKEKEYKMEKNTLPTVALRDFVMMPGLIIHFEINRKKSVAAIEQAMTGNQKIFLVTQKDAETEEPQEKDLYKVGVVASVKKISKVSEGIFRVFVEGEKRAELENLSAEQPDYLIADVKILEELPQTENEVQNEAMRRELWSLCLEYITLNPKGGKMIAELFKKQPPLGKLLDLISMNIPVSFSKRQSVLETLDLNERFEVMMEILSNELEILKAKVQIETQLKNKISQNQKEYLLKEQLNYIKEELGEEPLESEAEKFESDLQKLKASAKVKEQIKKEIKRFEKLNESSSESAVQRTYIETLLQLPWDRMSKESVDIDRTEKILDEQHYGLQKVKERILDFLAVRAFTKEEDSPILCLIGPPGTGKTSIAQSIAEALGKKYVRVCLGGVRDEAEIRGHRRTYVSALPGRIVEGLIQAKVKNPLMLLDEIDKVGADHSGDTSAALLEVLDSEQNMHFRDHYIEIPVDLSKVLFIATANDASDIPRPLLDRMELIEVSSYTANEKFHIARNFLVPKQLRKNGLSEKQISISDSALKNMIQYYTREAGVRELERKIGELCRKTARKILKQKGKQESVHITSRNLKSFLGKELFTSEAILSKPEIGVAQGLAWTSAGGETLKIEAVCMPGKGEIELTGQMGDVMKESAMIGLSYIRSIAEQYQIKAEFFKKNDFHIHIPEGAIPKDGSSAGITMASALLSAITRKAIFADVAMTGEITLRGIVLPIGGLKEKLLAARTAGIKRVLVPKENRKDVAEIEKEIYEGMKIIFVSDMDEVIENAFV